MITVINRCERANVLPPVVVAGNNEAKDALPDRTGEGGTEYALRQVQNTGATTVYYALQTDAANGSYHGQLLANEQLTVLVMGRVSIWGPGVWEVATVESVRTQG